MRSLNEMLPGSCPVALLESRDQELDIPLFGEPKCAFEL